MVLRFVGKRPNISAGDLATLLHVEKSTLSTALKRLETRRLITRNVDTDDNRRISISLTSAGRKFDHPAVGTVERAVRQTLDATKLDEIEVVRVFLQRLVSNLTR